MEELPFEEQYIADKTSVRVFSQLVDPEELKWHQDDETRIIKVKSGRDWFIQYDNHLPMPLREGKNYLVRRGEWHRIIKGSDDLIVEIKRI